MNLIQKIKAYFIKHEFSHWKDFSWDDYELKFRVLNDEVLLDIGNYIKYNLHESDSIGNYKYRLRENNTVRCESLDELLPFVKDILDRDYSETVVESRQHHWDFQYFVAGHPVCGNTICISNGLRALNGQTGNCIYALTSIRKYDNAYYCWNHLE